MNKEKFGDLVKARRSDQKMTQQDLAEAIGASRWYIQALERGEQWPSFEAAARLRATLEIDMNAILDALPNWSPADVQP
jgi:DNA-binding XRE family transcriptional regulator